MIWLQVAVTVLVVAVSAYGIEGMERAFLRGLFWMAVLFFMMLGIQREKAWAAVVVFVFAFFDFLGAVGGGISLENSFNLIEGVLSFVAMYGIIRWFRTRKPATVREAPSA